MKNLMVLFMSLMVGAAFAASTHLSLDNRTGVRVTDATERIRFSPAWETDVAGAVAVVSINGEVVKSANEAGYFEWPAPANGIYRFTHAVFVGGVQVGETLSVTISPSHLVPVTFYFPTGEGNMTTGGWGAWGCECDNLWHFNNEEVSIPEGIHEVSFEVRAGPDKDGVTRNWPAIFRVPEKRSITVETRPWPFNAEVWVYPGGCHGSVCFKAIGLASWESDINWTPERTEEELAKRKLDVAKCSVRVWNNETGEYIDLPANDSYFLSDGKYTVRGMYDGHYYDEGEWFYAGDTLTIDTQALFDNSKGWGDNYREIKLSYIRTDEASSLFRCKFDVNADDAVVDVPYMVVKNGTIFDQAFPKPRRPGYYFVGWYTKSEGGQSVRSLMPFRVDLTKLDRDEEGEKVAFVFYAHWEKNEDIRTKWDDDYGRYVYKVHDGVAELLYYESFEALNSPLLLPNALDGYPLGKIGTGFLDSGLPISVVEIPESVVSISAGAFKNCVNLRTVKFNGSVPTDVEISGVLDYVTKVYYPRKYAAQYEEIVPPEIFAGYTDDEVKPDGSYTEVIDGCTWYYVVENGEAIIGNWQDDCAPAVDPVPEKMVVPSILGGCPVVSIREFAFSMVDGLKSVVIPEGVRRIEEAAFDRCDDVVELRIPSTVEDMVGNAVYACKALKSIDVSADNAWFRTVDGMVITKDGRKLVMCPSGITGEVRIPDSVVDIGDSAFNMASITAVAIPNGVTNIGNSAFRYCAELRALEFPSALKRLGSYSIQGCFLLESLKLPSTVKEIGQDAFLQCYSLESIDIPSSVSSIGESAFVGCDMLTVVYVDKGDVERVRGLYDWPSGVEFAEVSYPSIEGDPGATVTGDAEKGFVVKPSEGKTAVEVTIPQGMDAAKVTIEVSPKVASVKPNGAKVKIVSGGADITEFLNVPSVDGTGVIDLTKATVKKEIVKEALDHTKGAKIELNSANPSLTTSNTRIGLFYTFREGRTLGGMDKSDSKTGDGTPWSPEIKVKGGNSAFYSIGVSKGE